MARLTIGILLSLVWRTNGGLPTPALTIRPERPLVERGGSVRLTCSMDCPGGKVQWEGLDTDLGNVVSNGTHSVLTVAKASVGVEGAKLCAGQCRKRSYQKKVALRVYAFPDTLRLESRPSSVLTSGEAARLTCSMSHVYPPGGLTLSWFQGAERLEAAPAEEEEMEGPQEQLFLYRSVLEVPAPVEGAAYTCRATLEVGQRTFSQEKVANVSLRATQGATVATSTLQTVRTSLGVPPDPSTTTTTGEIPFVATTGSLSPTTVAPSKADPATGSAGKTSSPGSTASNRPLSRIVEMWSRSPKPTTRGDPTSALLNATEDPARTGAPSTDDGPLPAVEDHSTPEEDLCRPVVQLVPPEGTVGQPLRISCRLAECGNGAQIQWVETPLSPARYRVEEAEGRSTLAVESVSLEHQGTYRCVARAFPNRAAVVRVVVSDAVSPDLLVSLGTAGSLLGLLITGYVSLRLRRKLGGRAASSLSVPCVYNMANGIRRKGL